MSQAVVTIDCNDLIAPEADLDRSALDHAKVTNLFIQNSVLRNGWS
jgi:hypothetical protein